MVRTVDRPRIADLDAAIVRGVLKDMLERRFPVLLVIACSVREYQGEGVRIVRDAARGRVPFRGDEEGVVWTWVTDVGFEGQAGHGCLGVAVTVGGYTAMNVFSADE